MRGGFRFLFFWKSVFLKHPSDHFLLHFSSLTAGPNWPLRCLVYDIPSKPLHQSSGNRETEDRQKLKDHLNEDEDFDCHFGTQIAISSELLQL